MKRQVDYVALCMDESGSMFDYRESAVKLLKEQFDKVQEGQADKSRTTYFSYYTFGSVVKRRRHVETSSATINLNEYNPNGGTPLLDCLAKAITDLQYHAVFGDDQSFLVILITDGIENISKATLSSVRDRVTALTDAGNWTFVALTPAGAGHRYVAELGFPEGNIADWNATDHGDYARASSGLAGSTGSYTTSRASGVRGSSTFFTDASKVDVSGLNVTSLIYKRYAVDKEMPINLFIPGKTGVPFETGRTFYQLTKTEARVQPDKEILLRNKATKVLYKNGRITTRSALGLPSDDKSTVRLKPGNHGEWDIFIQSKSDNRLLVRGTDVLYRA